MRKYLFTCLMALGLACSSQVYVGAGSSVCQGDFTYGAEVGYYNQTIALGLGDEFTPGIDSSNLVSFKMYGWIVSFGDFSIYEYAAMKVNVFTTILSAETGPVVYYTKWEHFYPQVSWTLNFASNSPITSSIGVGINYLW